MEDPGGSRDHLLCGGIHFSRNSCWRARRSAISSGGDALLGCGTRSLWLHELEGRALTDWAPLGVSIITRNPDLRPPYPGPEA